MLLSYMYVVVQMNVNWSWGIGKVEKAVLCWGVRNMYSSGMEKCVCLYVYFGVCNVAYGQGISDGLSVHFVIREMLHSFSQGWNLKFPCQNEMFISWLNHLSSYWLEYPSSHDYSWLKI